MLLVLWLAEGTGLPSNLLYRATDGVALQAISLAAELSPRSSILRRSSIIDPLATSMLAVSKITSCPLILCLEWMASPSPNPAWCGYKRVMDLHRFCSGQVLMLGGLLFEGHGGFPADC